MSIYLQQTISQPANAMVHASQELRRELGLDQPLQVTRIDDLVLIFASKVRTRWRLHPITQSMVLSSYTGHAVHFKYTQALASENSTDIG
jgi:hypothetical protein